MVVLPPGTLLQLMYLSVRIKKFTPGRFVEIGPGSGEIAAHLLKAGWVGTVYDLSDTTIMRLKSRFSNEIRDGKLRLVLGDFLEHSLPVDNDKRADLLISCMVMEHLPDEDEVNFMKHAALHIKKDVGRMIGIVPASQKHWGIEDDIAGHFRRYDREYLSDLMHRAGWSSYHVAGLTYPISNMLLPLSNYLVRRAEKNKTSLDVLERTKQSGHRRVGFKTHFPSFLKVLLNEVTMLPLFWLQNSMVNNANALVLYFEASPRCKE